DKYVSSENVVSAWARSRSMMVGSGCSTVARAASTTSGRTPRATASARTPLSHSPNAGSVPASWGGATSRERASTIGFTRQVYLLEVLEPFPRVLFYRRAGIAALRTTLSVFCCEPARNTLVPRTARRRGTSPRRELLMLCGRVRDLPRISALRC